MPKRLDRPNFKMPGYPWDGYIESLESKIHRLQAEVDMLTTKLQQPSLDGGGLFAAASTQVEPPEVGGALFQGDDAPDQNRLGGFTADSEESRKAALSNYPKSGNQRHRILLYVFGQSTHGATFDECQERLGIYSADRRITELVEGGWLERTGRTRNTRRGEEASVVVSTQKAAEWIRHRDTQAFQEVTKR